jgi:hypothetical protein
MTKLTLHSAMLLIIFIGKDNSVEEPFGGNIFIVRKDKSKLVLDVSMVEGKEEVDVGGEEEEEEEGEEEEEEEEGEVDKNANLLSSINIKCGEDNLIFTVIPKTYKGVLFVKAKLTAMQF